MIFFRFDEVSVTLYQDACRYIPGGVNSPVRAFRGVGGEPVFFARAKGAHVESADGRRYIDYVGSWGPMILGHADPRVIRAVQEKAADGLSFGAPTAIETEVAKRIIERVPSIELVRMVNSGTEATMSAIRLARGFTGRDLIVKFEGCYHGHSDSLLVKAGSGMLTLGVPTSPGVPADFAKHTLTLGYNDTAALEACFALHGTHIAGVIVEPVAGNMNCIPPAPGFLERMRELCTDHGAVLIFDEVMTGFRVAAGGAQQLYGIRPDLTTLGKVVGGGMPVGAFGGRRDIMSRLAPLGLHLQVHFEPSLIHGLAGPLSRSAVPVVVDHMARVDARLGAGHADFAALEALMRDTRFHVKVSGIDRVDTTPPYAHGIALARRLVDAFADRCVWGTDWPHPNHTHVPDDGALVDALEAIAPDPAVRRRLLVDTPARLYRFEAGAPAVGSAS